jgi:hypothetical protein
MTRSALILILIMNRPNVINIQEPLLYICISFEGLSHLYLKYMGLCVTRPSVARWG